jgi:chromosome segregation ATPase
MEGDSQQWFTYAALGERLRVSPEAVRAKAIRQAWRRQPGNDGKTLVQPPPEILHTPVQRAINGRAPPVRRTGDQATLTALREHISTLREDNERLRGDLTVEKGRADRAVTESAELKTNIERLTAELAGERTTLAVERAARQADQEQHQEQLTAERTARQADQEHAAARQADQEQQLAAEREARRTDEYRLAAARALADKATAELVELARRLAAIAEKQTAAETAEVEPEPLRRSAAGRAWRWFLRN